MADAAPVVHIGENSPEQVAFKLLQYIANAEGKNLGGLNVNTDRDWLLRTYAQCIYVVRNPTYVGDALKPNFGE